MNVWGDERRGDECRTIDQPDYSDRPNYPEQPNYPIPRRPWPLDPSLSEMINLCNQSGTKHTGQKKCTHNKCEACSKVMSTFRFSQLNVLILLSSLKEEASSTVEDDPLLAAWRWPPSPLHSCHHSNRFLAPYQMSWCCSKNWWVL